MKPKERVITPSRAERIARARAVEGDSIGPIEELEPRVSTSGVLDTLLAACDTFLAATASRYQDKPTDEFRDAVKAAKEARDGKSSARS